MTQGRRLDTKQGLLLIVCAAILIKDGFCLYLSNDVPEYIQCVKQTYLQVLPALDGVTQGD